MTVEDVNENAVLVVLGLFCKTLVCQADGRGTHDVLFFPYGFAPKLVGRLRCQETLTCSLLALSASPSLASTTCGGKTYSACSSRSCLSTLSCLNLGIVVQALVKLRFRAGLQVCLAMQEGASGITFAGCMEVLKTARPRVVVFENVELLGSPAVLRSRSGAGPDASWPISMQLTH